MTCKHWMTIVFLATGMMLLTGCDQLEFLNKTQVEWTPQEPTALSVSTEGIITEYVKDTLDASYYSASELETMINTEVGHYNSKHEIDSVTVKEFIAEGDKVSLTMEYKTAADYAEFNNTELFCGSLISAQLEGYLFDVPFYKIKNGKVQGGEVTSSEVVTAMDKMVMVLQAPMEVKLPGSVLFTSTNAEMLASDVVYATGEKEEPVQELILPSNKVYVFGGHDHTVAEAEAANRVYIVFNEK